MHCAVVCMYAHISLTITYALCLARPCKIIAVCALTEKLKKINNWVIECFPPKSEWALNVL